MSPPKRLTICADDFAASESVSTAILALAEKNRISAVSCMANARLWHAHAPALVARRGDVLIGLHLNLTLREDPQAMRLPRLMLAALLGQLDPAAIRARFRRQLDEFTDAVGVLPDFIDGHEHVHAFPVIADVVRELAAEANRGRPIPIRDVRHFFGQTDAPFKRAVIRSLATRGRRNPGAERATSLNSAFGGDYSLSPHADYASLFQSWLETAPDGALIMCHPGSIGSGTGSQAGSGTAARAEFEFLRSEACGNLLDWHGIRFVSRTDLRLRALDAETARPAERHAPAPSSV